MRSPKNGHQCRVLAWAIRFEFNHYNMSLIFRTFSVLAPLLVHFTVSQSALCQGPAIPPPELNTSPLSAQIIFFEPLIAKGELTTALDAVMLPKDLKIRESENFEDGFFLGTLKVDELIFATNTIWQDGRFCCFGKLAEPVTLKVYIPVEKIVPWGKLASEITNPTTSGIFILMLDQSIGYQVLAHCAESDRMSVLNAIRRRIEITEEWCRYLKAELDWMKGSD